MYFQVLYISCNVLIKQFYFNVGNLPQMPLSSPSPWQNSQKPDIFPRSAPYLPYIFLSGQSSSFLQPIAHFKENHN